MNKEMELLRIFRVAVKAAVFAMQPSGWGLLRKVSPVPSSNWSNTTARCCFIEARARCASPPSAKGC